MPVVRERLRDIEATLRKGTAQARLALGALLGEQRLRVFADGRIEGSATLAPETLAAPRRTRGRRDSVVAGARYARRWPTVPPVLPIEGMVRVAVAAG